MGKNRFPASVVQYTQYYPSGLPWASNSGDNPAWQNKKYNGKEFVEMNNYDTYDYGARGYYPAIGRFTTVDPLCEKYYSISPYSYCGGNPVNRIDPDGMDWFYYSIDGKSDPTWNWRDESSYHTGVKDSNGKEVVLQGQKAVVTFNGSQDEKLGEGSNLFSAGAKLADVTVYGPDGKNDIQHYKGFTMTSDFNTFGAIADGEYTVNYRTPGKSGKLKSNWAINNTDPVNTLGGDNPSPLHPFSSTQKDGVYIHSSNSTGFAGSIYNKGKLAGAITTGCLLIVPSGHGMNGFDEFNNQLQGVSTFHLVLTRTLPINSVVAPISTNFKNKWKLF